MKRIKAVILKELFHILRDRRSLIVVFVMPVTMIFIFGYSISYDLNTIPLAVIDQSHGEAARELARRFAANGYFSPRRVVQEPGEEPLQAAERRLQEGKIKEIVIIPPDFDARLSRGQAAEVGVVIDGSDSNVANLIYQYTDQLVMNYAIERMKTEPFLKIHTKIFFNPEVKSSFFFIPGIIAILLLMISAMLTSLSIAREKETGSIDLLFISPLRSVEIIVGKTVPYIAVALMTGMIILLFARFWFGIPIRGSLLVLFFFALLYIVTGLSFGILISAVSSSQSTAMMAALLATMLPSIMLSGFIFPLESLHPILRLFSYIVPATYFLRIIRGVILKGAALKDFIFEGGMMIAFSLLWLGTATRRFTQLRKHAS